MCMFRPRMRGELLFLYNGVRPRNVMPVHGTWRMLRAPMPAGRQYRRTLKSVLLTENGVSVDLVVRQSQYLQCAVPVGRMFVDGLIAGDVRRYHPGRNWHLSSGCRGDRRGQGSGTGQPFSCPHLLAGFLRRSQGARTRRAQGGGRAGIVGGRQRHRSIRIAQRECAARTVSLGGNLSPPADVCQTAIEV